MAHWAWLGAAVPRTMTTRAVRINRTLFIACFLQCGRDVPAISTRSYRSAAADRKRPARGNPVHKLQTTGQDRRITRRVNLPLRKDVRRKSAYQLLNLRFDA